jgi:hypothetical protein
MQLYNTYDTFICCPTTNTPSAKMNLMEEEPRKTLNSVINRTGFNRIAPFRAHDVKTTEIEVSSEKIGIKRKKEET